MKEKPRVCSRTGKPCCCGENGGCSCREQKVKESPKEDEGTTQ